MPRCRKSIKLLLQEKTPSGKIISSRVIDGKSRDLFVLLRDARTTKREIDDAPTLRKRSEMLRARDSAIEILMRMYRDAEKRGSLARLDMRVRNLIEGIKAGNDGRLPMARGGAPTGRGHCRLLLAVQVREAIAAQGKKRLTDAVLRNVAEQKGVGYDYLKRIHYDRDPEWGLDVKTERARMKWEATVPFSPALWFWEEDSFLLFLIAPR
jgi:hypothetical protein